MPEELANTEERVKMKAQERRGRLLFGVLGGSAVALLLWTAVTYVAQIDAALAQWVFVGLLVLFATAFIAFLAVGISGETRR